jgi:phosphopantothenoylcysteine synthetase/decarboxylase
VDKLANKKIIATSGPTRGPIDAMRYITNKSSGRLGAMIAMEALKAGAEVSYVYGKDSLTPYSIGLEKTKKHKLTLMEIETVDDLIEVVRGEIGGRSYSAMIHSMAVLDYIPDRYIDAKTPSDSEEWTIRLVKTPKVIKMVKELDPEILLVGFKLEYAKSTEELVKIAHDSLVRNRADFVLANDLRQIESGNHIGYLVNTEGRVEGVFSGKEEIARGLIKAVAEGVSGIGGQGSGSQSNT